MNVFLTWESHVWKSLKGSLSLVFGDKVGEEGADQTKHNSNVVKEANLAEDTFFGFEKILQAETYQRYEVWYEVDWRDKVDQAPNVHKGTQSTLSKIHDKQTKLGTYLILYSVQHMPQPSVLIHLEC